MKKNRCINGTKKKRKKKIKEKKVVAVVDGDDGNDEFYDPKTFYFSSIILYGEVLIRYDNSV